MARVEQEGPIIPLSETVERDRRQAEADYAYVEKTLVDLMSKPFERYSGFEVKRGKEAKSKGSYDRLEVVMIATSEETAAASREVQALFMDLGLKKDDQLAVKLSLGKRTAKPHPDYANKLYEIELMPTKNRPELYGILLTYWPSQFWFETSGSPFDDENHASLEDRAGDLALRYDLLMNGMVHDSEEIGTHAPYTQYKHLPHPRMATMRRGLTDWIVGLIDARMK